MISKNIYDAFAGKTYTIQPETENDLSDDIEEALKLAELPKFCYNTKLSTEFLCPREYPERSGQ
jgi:hypothetical protein